MVYTGCTMKFEHNWTIPYLSQLTQTAQILNFHYVMGSQDRLGCTDIEMQTHDVDNKPPGRQKEQDKNRRKPKLHTVSCYNQ